MTYDIILGRNQRDRKKYANQGTILIAKQYIQMGQVTALANKVYLDVNQSHAIFVVGKRGSGKSYSLGVIAEGLYQLPTEQRKKISFILLDTMGIYWTMKYPNHKDEELLKKWEMQSSDLPVQIYTPAGFFEQYKEQNIPTDFPFAILPSELSASDWAVSFEIPLHNEQGVVLETVISQRKDSNEPYSLQDIIDDIYQFEADSTTKHALMNRFENAKRWGVFSETATPMQDLVIGGQITVLDLSPYATMENGWAIKSLVVGLISKKLFSERMKARKTEELRNIENATQYFGAEQNTMEQPLVWLILDESHEFLPIDKHTTATDALTTILKEGRQPGISLVLASQQPGKIHTDVMTQSDIIIAHRLTAQIDVKALTMVAQSYFEEGLIKALNELSDDPGAAIILDDTNERIFPVRMKPRVSWHGGSAPHLVNEVKKEAEF